MATYTKNEQKTGILAKIGRMQQNYYVGMAMVGGAVAVGNAIYSDVQIARLSAAYFKAQQEQKKAVAKLDASVETTEETK